MRCLSAIAAFLLTLSATGCTWEAKAHEIYTGVTGKDGQLCCGGNDCFRTTYREQHGDHFFFVLKPQDGGGEIEIPSAMITWLPVPGDDADAPPNRAHLCYRASDDADAKIPNYAGRIVDGAWLIYCAFIPPGAT